MSRIDRYISLLFWGYFAGAILVFVTIFAAVDAMSMLVNYKDVSTTALAEYYLYYTPEVLHKMLPVACLLATILTLSNLNKSNELISLFASGMSLFRVAAPILVWVGIICGVGYWAADQALPRLAVQKNYIFYHEIKKRPSAFSTIKTNKIWYRSKNAIFNIKTLSPQGDVAQGLSLYFFDEDWNLLQMLSADKVRLAGKNWQLSDGTVTIFTADSSFPLTSKFKNKTIVMGEEAQDLQNSGQTSEMLSQEELKKFIEKNSEAGLDTLAYQVDYHAKIGFAFTGLVLALLGIPFSVSRARSGSAMLNLGICLGLVFAYYVLNSSAITLAQHGAMPPWLGGWAANGVMAAMAYSFLKRTNY
ncbi:MAG: LPS export ABC transporter permease LptG [Bdellovibrionia bacterium]